MKHAALWVSLLALPTVTIAQKQETVKATPAQKKARQGDLFVFPDNIKLSKNELNERVMAKTEELTRYIKELAESNGTDAATVDAAMKLFNHNEYATVTVTRKNEKAPLTVPVRTYLKRLNRLKYNKVQITWHNAQYVSNFTRQPDGNYVGLVAFEQEFTGVRNGEANYTYHDVTEKHVEVTVKVWKATDKKNAWVEVFLGNIGVTEQ